jgi:hypothetical protein
VQKQPGHEHASTTAIYEFVGDDFRYALAGGQRNVRSANVMKWCASDKYPAQRPVTRATCAMRGTAVGQPRRQCMSSAQLYDTIGATYTVTRRTEPRIAAQIWAALGDARTVLNVGAGTGSYEPPGRDVTAVEPSALMRAQRAAGAAPCVAAAAERLPFEDQSFDAALAIATVHQRNIGVGQSRAGR